MMSNSSKKIWTDHIEQVPTGQNSGLPAEKYLTVFDGELRADFDGELRAEQIKSALSLAGVFEYGRQSARLLCDWSILAKADTLDIASR